MTWNAFHNLSLRYIKWGVKICAMSNTLLEVCLNRLVLRFTQSIHILSRSSEVYLRERLDQGLLEVALLIEPIETAKYNYLVLPTKDAWGVLMRSADPLAKKGALTREALYKLPLIIPHRNLVRDELTDILKIAPSKLNILVESNLSSNALQLVKYGHYYLLGIKGVYELHNDPEITFLPFSPLKQTGHVLAWRKNALLSPVTQKFIQFVTDASNI